jgi:hypothetical protein
VTTLQGPRAEPADRSAEVAAGGRTTCTRRSDSKCFPIGWGGAEVLLNSYQVLVGDGHGMRWVDASSGEVPAGAISGGHEPGRPDLYVCRVNHYGLQPGKLVGENCNIGYGGREIYFSSYQILVQTRYSRPAPGHGHHRHARYR